MLIYIYGWISGIWTQSIAYSKWYGLRSTYVYRYGKYFVGLGIGVKECVRIRNVRGNNIEKSKK